MMVVMAKTGAPLKTPATPLGILDLEFAYDSSKAAAVINAWMPVDASPGIIPAAKTNTYFDFLFLFFYSFFLFLACRRIADHSGGLIQKAGNLIASGALLAGLFDIIENLGMLVTLGGHVSGTIAFLTTFFSVIKWILALAAVLYMLSGMLMLLWRKIRN